MQTEKSLMIKSKWKNSKIMQLLNKIFNKFGKNKNELLKEKQSLSDVEILKELVEERKNIRDIDSETKKRLIELCNNRTKEVREKIEERKERTRNMEQFLIKVNNSF